MTGDSLVVNLTAHWACNNFKVGLNRNCYLYRAQLREVFSRVWRQIQKAFFIFNFRSRVKDSNINSINLDSFTTWENRVNVGYIFIWRLDK